MAKVHGGSAAEALIRPIFEKHVPDVPVDIVLQSRKRKGLCRVKRRSIVSRDPLDPQVERRVRKARKEAMFALHETGKYSFNTIARIFNLTSHTSVVQAVKTQEASLEL